MEPKIVSLGPLCLAGRPYYGNPENRAFRKAWKRFDTNNIIVPGRVDSKIIYALAVYGPEFLTEHNWFYMPAVQVVDLSSLPGVLFGKILPACTYAVFTANQGPSSVPETSIYGYNKWLPKSDYDVAFSFDFELYDEDRYHGDGPHDEIDVYIPIKLKVG
jgi:predicted transcriptional regulator YdeE